MGVRFLASVPLVLLAACGSGDPEAALEAVKATQQAHLEAIANNDLRGAVRVYQDGAVLVAPGAAPTAGPEAIVDAFEGLLRDRNFDLEITPGPAWAAAGGDLAVTTYTAQLTTTDAATGNPVTTQIGNQTVWRKNTGKPWQIVSDYNAVLPAGGLTT